MNIIKSLKSILVIIPAIALFFIGMKVFPKNAAMHGVFPHPSLVVFLLLFQFINWYEVILLGSSLAIGHIISLKMFVDFDQVASIWVYEFMALPAFLAILSLVFALFRYFRQKDETLASNNLAEEKSKCHHLDKSSKDLEQANNELKIKLAMSNQGVPQILDSMINFWKEEEDLASFEQVILPLIGKGKLQIEMPGGRKALVSTSTEFVTDENVQQIWKLAWDESKDGSWFKSDLIKYDGPILCRIFFRKKIPEGIIFWAGMSSFELKNAEIYWESIWELWRLKNEDKIGQSVIDKNLILDYDNDKFRAIFRFYRLLGGQSVPLEREQVWRISRVLLAKGQKRMVTLFQSKDSQSIFWGILPENEREVLQEVNDSLVFKRLNYSLQSIKD